MKEMIKDALILFAITLIAGVLLGGVYQVTKEPIEQQNILASAKASQEVFSDATSFVEYEEFDLTKAGNIIHVVFSGQDIESVSCAMSGDTILGYVLTVVTHEGYGGDIRFMMGVRLDGTLNGISLLSISETAGLGMQAEDVLVPQFANKNVSSFSYTKTGALNDSEIDAISGATITTNAITNGVNAGLYYFENVLGGE